MWPELLPDVQLSVLHITGSSILKSSIKITINTIRAQHLYSLNDQGVHIFAGCSVPTESKTDANKKNCIVMQIIDLISNSSIW